MNNWIAFFESITMNQGIELIKGVIGTAMTLPGFINDISAIIENKKRKKEKATKRHTQQKR